mgnify:CR=1 FL=1
MDADARAFHMEEYRQLRAEVIGLLSRIETLFRYSLVVFASVFAWLVVNSFGVSESMKVCVKLPRPVLAFGWLIPPAFVVCAGLMSKVAKTRVDHFGAYLAKLESTLGSRGLGWEGFLSPEESILTNTAARLWWLLLGLSIMATSIGLCTLFATTSGCPAAK